MVKRSQIKVKGHLRSTCKITWKCEFRLFCKLEDQLELPNRCGDQGQMLTCIIHKPRWQATLAVRGLWSIFSLLSRMHISVLLGHDCLSNRSISKGYSKSDAPPWVEKSSTSGGFHAYDTWLYWSSENALHEHFIAERWRSTTAHHSGLKNASILVWIQPKAVFHRGNGNFKWIDLCTGYYREYMNVKCKSIH